MEWYLYPAVVGAGFVCGFINTLAGSGSLVTLPLLIFLGLPANVANGTNRVGILFQNIVAVGAFKRQRLLSLRRGLLLALPAVVGSVLGARIAVNLDETTMRHTIGALMLVMLCVIIVKPERWLRGRPEALQRPVGFIQIALMFGIGIYGGFIQAGVGIFLIAALVLGVGFDLVRTNAVKVLIILCYTPFALAVFMANHQVQWGLGLVLSLGNMSGAWVAAHLAAKKGAGFVRWFLIAIVILSAAKLLGLFDVFGRLFT